MHGPWRRGEGEERRPVSTALVQLCRSTTTWMPPTPSRPSTSAQSRCVARRGRAVRGHARVWSGAESFFPAPHALEQARKWLASLPRRPVTEDDPTDDSPMVRDFRCVSLDREGCGVLAHCAFLAFSVSCAPSWCARASSAPTGPCRSALFFPTCALAHPNTQRLCVCSRSCFCKCSRCGWCATTPTCWVAFSTASWWGATGC